VVEAFKKKKKVVDDVQSTGPSTATTDAGIMRDQTAARQPINSMGIVCQLKCISGKDSLQTKQ